MAILGVRGAAVIHDRWSIWNLDGERTLPVLFSTDALLIAGGLALLAGHRRSYPRHLTWTLLGVLLIFMGIDEYAGIHERLESTAGIDWQTLYIPLALVLGLAGASIVHGLRHNRAALALMLAGAAGWAASQLLEDLQWQAGLQSASYNRQMYAEEMLEMVGSSFILLALYLAVLSAAGPDRQRAADRPAS